jgi:septal ring factor EnvC (AmiA/AmiB activator)
MEASPPQTPPEQPAQPPATGSQPVVTETPEQRLEGLRAWVAQIERKLGIRSLAGGAALVLALAAGIVGVVLALSAKDESATKSEVRSLAGELESVQREAAEAAEEDVASVLDRLDALEGRVNTIASGQRTTESELEVVQDDIEDLRGQVTDLENAPPPDSGGNADNN